MTKFTILAIAPALLALAACGGTAEEPDTSAEDFAARINGTQAPAAAAPGTGAAPATANPGAPQVAKPLGQAAPGMYIPGTATDPESAICSANVMGPYLGRPANAATRAAIQNVATGASEIRYLEPGSAFVTDPTSLRLNLMLDATGVIRDARCG